MEKQNYIDEKMKEFAMNIDEFSIGQIIEDEDKSHCKITNKTLNTIEVAIKFAMKEFNKRFKVLKT